MKGIFKHFGEIIPEDSNHLLYNMNKWRDTIKGDFHENVKTLNQIQKVWLKKNPVRKKLTTYTYKL